MSVNIRVIDSNQEQFIRASASKLPSVPSRLAKPPVTLFLVWKILLKRLGATPIKEMVSTSKGKFGKEDVAEKIEGNFIKLRRHKLASALEGLTCLSPISKVKGAFYTHTGSWEHSAKDINFKLSIYRYRDDTVLIVLTRWDVLPSVQAEQDRIREEQRREKAAIDKALADLEPEGFVRRTKTSRPSAGTTKTPAKSTKNHLFSPELAPPTPKNTKNH